MILVTPLRGVTHRAARRTVKPPCRETAISTHRHRLPVTRAGALRDEPLGLPLSDGTGILKPSFRIALFNGRHQSASRDSHLDSGSGRDLLRIADDRAIR